MIIRFFTILFRFSCAQTTSSSYPVSHPVTLVVWENLASRFSLKGPPRNREKDEERVNEPL
jgi:hypothetical protein